MNRTHPPDNVRLSVQHLRDPGAVDEYRVHVYARHIGSVYVTDEIRVQYGDPQSAMVAIEQAINDMLMRTSAVSAGWWGRRIAGNGSRARP